MAVTRVLETSVYVDDLALAERFYREVLGLETFTREPGRHVFFRCGDGMLLLFDPRTTATGQVVVGQAPVPRHGAVGAGHVAFGVPASEMDGWRASLIGHGVAIESEVDWPGGGRSIYFRDPAGNSLELATPETWGLSG